MKKDEEENEYVTLDIDEFEKNHGPFDKDYEGGIMYATNSANCPVLSYKKYISKLNPEIKFLFQRPRLEGNNSFGCEIAGENDERNKL